VLQLPDDWAHSHGGYLAHYLREQLPDHLLRVEFDRCFLAASIKLMAQTFPLRFDPDLREATHTAGRLNQLAAKDIATMKQTRFGWEIGSLAYAYFGVLDDELIDEFLKKYEGSTSVNVISPPRQDNTLQHTLLLRGNRLFSGNVTDYYFFVSWRVTTASLDSTLSHAHTLKALLHNYDGLVRRTPRRDELRIVCAKAS
jgi:hypothetical protein